MATITAAKKNKVVSVAWINEVEALFFNGSLDASAKDLGE
jgi:hypothetical protein